MNNCQQVIKPVFATDDLQCTSRGVEETSFPRCLLVRVVDCLMGEKCLVVDGVYTCRTCMPGEGDVWILHSAEIGKKNSNNKNVKVQHQ